MESREVSGGYKHCKAIKQRITEAIATKVEKVQHTKEIFKLYTKLNRL